MFGLKLFSWQACNKTGDLVTGWLVAKNILHAKKILLQRSLIPVKMHYHFFYLQQFSHRALPDFFFSNLAYYWQTV